MKISKNTRQLLELFYIKLQGKADFSNLELYEVKEILEDIQCTFTNSFAFEEYTNKNSNFRQNIDLLCVCLEAVDCDFNDLEYSDFFNLLKEIETDKAGDFYITSLPCGEVRIIEVDAIDRLWTDSLIEQIKDCYDLSDLPGFVQIDWETTAENCKVDGMGHHFNSYDGQEYESGNYYIFRTN